MNKNRIYAAIDLKSFYASVECVERGLDPLTTNLVVADKSRTDKTICLAVSPSLKSYGIPGRPRLFEVIQKIDEINKSRISKAGINDFSSSSFISGELEKNPELKLDYIVATPQMSRYIEVSSKIFDIYLRYVSPEDMHVYSIDEVFIDITDYISFYNLEPKQLVMKMIKDVLSATGITATAGIGTNLYLCKIAMDIEAKHIPADKNGVRIAELDEIKYREKLWSHQPLTDFWRIGSGYSERLEKLGLFTMGDIALFSMNNSEILYKEFGVNAELLIDHAWGWEPVEIADIKQYTPENNSISSGQVLQHPYSFDEAETVLKEMVDSLVIDLISKHIITDQIILTVCYDSENFSELNSETPLKEDRYGRIAPKDAHGSVNLDFATSSLKIISEKFLNLYETIVNKKYSVRRIYVIANHLKYEKSFGNNDCYEQLNFFTDSKISNNLSDDELKKERKKQDAIISIKDKYGKNSILKGLSLKKEATAKSRNSQIGGHKA